MSAVRVAIAALILAAGAAQASPRCPSTGLASWYGASHNGRPTASGEPFRSAALTAASRCLPLGAIIEVTHRHRSVIVRINDRGPYVSPRILDLSHEAANRLHITGVGFVRIRVLSRP
jgi:rare lipoprotein A